MTLLTYQVFKTIADVGSFHKAADILGLTPSAISHAISSMENELGFSVLTRSKAGVSLTNYGEQLLPYVNAVLNCDESLKQEIAELNGLKQGKVKYSPVYVPAGYQRSYILLRRSIQRLTLKSFRELTMMLYTGSRTEL